MGLEVQEQSMFVVGFPEGVARGWKRFERRVGVAGAVLLGMGVQSRRDQETRDVT